MSDIIVLIRGGVFQGAISDSKGNRIMVVDYDDEAAAGADSVRMFQRIRVDRRAFERICKEGAEQN